MLKTYGVCIRSISWEFWVIEKVDLFRDISVARGLVVLLSFIYSYQHRALLLSLAAFTVVAHLFLILFIKKLLCIVVNLARHSTPVRAQELLITNRGFISLDVVYYFVQELLLQIIRLHPFSLDFCSKLACHTSIAFLFIFRLNFHFDIFWLTSWNLFWLWFAWIYETEQWVWICRII